jgi:hypothetical protein
MGEKGKIRGNRQKPLPIQAARQPPPRKSILRRIAYLLSPTGWFWTSVSLVLAIVGSYFLFRTHIAIDPDVSLNPSDAGATLFRFTNQGVLPVYDLKRDLSVNYMRNPTYNANMVHVRIINFSHPVKKLSSGESTTLSIPNAEGLLRPAGGHMPYTEADIKIDYSYKDVCAFLHSNSVRFQAVTGTDHVIHWFHKAIDE